MGGEMLSKSAEYVINWKSITKFNMQIKCYCRSLSFGISVSAEYIKVGGWRRLKNDWLQNEKAREAWWYRVGVSSSLPSLTSALFLLSMEAGGNK